MIHFSVDDSIEIFRYLTENKCRSIFENPVLRYFKELSDEYNFVVSMYCFYEKDGFNLSMCSDKYKEEFAKNAFWLKFGFHALNDKANYKNSDVTEFRTDLLKTVTPTGSSSTGWSIGALPSSGKVATTPRRSTIPPRFPKSRSTATATTASTVWAMLSGT